jgi:RHS repeat-associated protein
MSEKAGASTAQVLLPDIVHGDIEAEATATTGVLNASVTYDPYGQITSHTGTLPLGYQSGWTDTTTGNVNAPARWYSPSVGALTGRDTVQLPASSVAQTNRYAYGNDNPETNRRPASRWPPWSRFRWPRCC